jgi:hypothetical protein
VEHIAKGLPFKNQAFHKLFVDAMRKAGLKWTQTVPKILWQSSAKQIYRLRAKVYIRDTPEFI